MTDAQRPLPQQMQNAETGFVAETSIDLDEPHIRRITYTRYGICLSTQTNERKSMKVSFRPSSEQLQRLQVGPIGPHVITFAALISQQGYCDITGWVKVRLVAKLSRWLQRRG